VAPLRPKASTYNSKSVSRDESRNPFANGFESILSFVICCWPFEVEVEVGVGVGGGGGGGGKQVSVSSRPATERFASFVGKQRGEGKLTL